MSFLSSLGNKIRNGFDDIGSVVTGNPAHGPAPVSAPIVPIQQPQPWHAPMALPQQQPPPIVSQPNTGLFNAPSTTPSSIIAPPSAGTFKVAPARPHASILHNITHNPVTNVTGGVIKGIANQGAALARSGYDIGRGAAADITNNNQALINANQAKARDNPMALAPITRPVMQVVRTVEHPFTSNSYTPTSPEAQRVFGAAPVQNIAAGYQTTAKKHGALVGGLYAAGQTAQDALLLAGAKKGADEASTALHKLPDAIRTNGLEIATADKPVTMVPAHALTSYEGAPDRTRVDFYKQQIKSGEPIKPVIAIQDSTGKLGIEDGKHRYQAYKELGINDIPTKVTTWDEIKAKNQGGYLNLGGNDGSLPEENNGRTDKASVNGDDLSSSGSIDPLVASKQEAPTEATGAKDNLNRTRPEQTNPQINQPPEAQLQSSSARSRGSSSSANSTTPSAEQIGRALGLTDEQMAQARSSAEDVNEAIARNRAAARDTLPPEDRGIGSLQHERTPRLIAEENTAKNPMKVNIPEVRPGDYEKARSNAQLASSPIEYSAGQVTKALRKLKPSEKSNFWKAVEDPKLIKSEEMKEAVSRWKNLSNRVHATSQALGGNTGYIENYARHKWDLTDPEDAARFEELVNQRGGATVDPYDFAGLDRQARVFKSITEGEQAGFKLKNPNNPEQDVIDYAKGSAYALKQQALQKGMTEADMNEPVKNRSFDLRNGKTLALSERGNHEMRAYQDIGKGNVANRAFRVTNKKLKQTLLSASEFHPINISLLKAGPAEALAGHPVLAAKGMYGTIRSQLGRTYSDRLQQTALKDGTVDAAARIGTPIKYGSDYAAEGKQTLGKQGFGERTIFEKAMPAMHIRMVQGAVKDLEKRGIPLDSPEARKLGDTINKTMGFINGELKNDNPHVQRVLSNLALAPQFTRAKWSVLKDAITRGGLSGTYARSAVIGNTAAVAAISSGLSLLVHQNSDNKKDLVTRNIVHPSIPTPFKDAKGNTIELGLPSTYASEALGLGANVTRNNNGRLGITVKPGNIPGNLANYGRARLSIIPGTALKIATNTDFANKPLYDPTAPIGTKAIQAGTTTAQGLLPIGLQGALQTNAVKSRLPATSQEILNANQPGTNGLIKGIASAFGATPRTDKTVGKGLQTTQYYDALGAATKGLNANDKAAFASIHQQSKDPVTGQYIIKPTVFDSLAKAALYLQHPNVLAADTKLNQKLQFEGQAVDPFFNLSPQQQKAYLAYQTVDKNNTAQLTAWQQANPWFTQFQKDRAVFYNSLPPGDPLKPKSPVEYPSEPADVQKSFDEYNSITDPVARSQYFGQHPELSQYMDQMTNYTNQLLVAQGLTPLKPYPKADAETESFMNTYMNNKPARASLRASNPIDYQKMEAYLQNVDEYEVARNGALDQLQGQTPSQKLLKGISGLANFDMVTNPDGSLALKYGTTGDGATTYGSVSALPQAGATSGSGYGSHYKSNRTLKAAKPRYLKNKKPYTKFVKKRTPRKYFASTKAQVKGSTKFIAPAKPKTIKLAA